MVYNFSMPSDERLYHDLAWLFPIVSPPEDYVNEAAEFARAIRQHARIPVKTLLDLGCGAGHNDHHLQKDFKVTGVDLSETMLDLARCLNPEVEYLTGDLRSLCLGRTFDAVIIADSITYMLNEDDLLAAFRTAYAHLNPGGVFCSYAEETPENFVQNGTYTSTHYGKAENGQTVEVALVENYYDPNPQDTAFESTFVYFIRQGGKLRIETDSHQLGIFPPAVWERLLRQAGFDVYQAWFDEADAPLFVGVK
jgi:SAM-dependent methyltransferase